MKFHPAIFPATPRLLVLHEPRLIWECDWRPPPPSGVSASGTNTSSQWKNRARKCTQFHLRAAPHCFLKETIRREALWMSQILFLERLQTLHWQMKERNPDLTTTLPDTVYLLNMLNIPFTLILEKAIQQPQKNDNALSKKIKTSPFPPKPPSNKQVW